MFDKNPDEIYLIKDCLQNENILSYENYGQDTLISHCILTVLIKRRNDLKPPETSETTCNHQETT